jgi:IS4 transposase
VGGEGRLIEDGSGVSNIPPKNNRRWKNRFSPYLYRKRNVIERMFGRLKDFRRIATRYDHLAQNFLAAVYLAATVSYWLMSVEPRALKSLMVPTLCLHLRSVLMR